MAGSFKPICIDEISLIHGDNHSYCDTMAEYCFEAFGYYPRKRSLKTGLILDRDGRRFFRDCVIYFKTREDRMMFHLRWQSPETEQGWRVWLKIEPRT